MRSRRRDLFTVGQRKTEYPDLTLTAKTTAASEVVTLGRLTPASGKSLVVDWGDGTEDTTVTSGYTSAINHTYALAGSRQITISFAKDIVQLQLAGTKLGDLNTLQLRYSKLTRFSINGLQILSGLGAPKINSADMINWDPIHFSVEWTETGYPVIFNSRHVSHWSPSTFVLETLPSSAGVINTGDLVNWNPVEFSMVNLSSGFNFIPGGGVSGWSNIEGFKIMGISGMTTEKWNAILWEIYQATKLKTAYVGTLELDDSTVVPSGQFVACASCPVNANTPGLQILYEIQAGSDDTCLAISYGWEEVIQGFA